MGIWQRIKRFFRVPGLDRVPKDDGPYEITWGSVPIQPVAGDLTNEIMRDVAAAMHTNVEAVYADDKLVWRKPLFVGWDMTREHADTLQEAYWRVREERAEAKLHAAAVGLALVVERSIRGELR